MNSSDACQWDVVIVGASFAGAACALAARQAGLRVCVLERKRDPGIRLHTTGIIVGEAAESTWLARVPPAFTRRIEHVRLYAPNLRDLSLHSPGYYFLTTDTPNVMRWLADEMRAQGIELRLMQSFTDARREGDTWQVDGLGRTRWLVGADGAKSRVAAHAGLGRVRDFLYGIEYEFAGASLQEPGALHCFISKRHAPGYIGWATQNPAGVQFGLAFRHRTSRTGTPDIDGLLHEVGGRLGLAPGQRASATRAGLIPCGGPVAPLAAPGVILTGDAAGIVSPVTAGGIHSAWPWLGRRRSHRPASVRARAVSATGGDRCSPAFPYQARAALGIRSCTGGLAIQSVAGDTAAALGRRTSVFPPADVGWAHRVVSLAPPGPVGMAVVPPALRQGE